MHVLIRPSWRPKQSKQIRRILEDVSPFRQVPSSVHAFTLTGLAWNLAVQDFTTRWCIESHKETADGILNTTKADGFPKTQVLYIVNNIYICNIFLSGNKYVLVNWDVFQTLVWLFINTSSRGQCSALVSQGKMFLIRTSMKQVQNPWDYFVSLVKERERDLWYAAVDVMR